MRDAVSANSFSNPSSTGSAGCTKAGQRPDGVAMEKHHMRHVQQLPEKL